MKKDIKNLGTYPNKNSDKTKNRSFESNRFNSILNPYFGFTQNNKNELDLHESLVQEAIQIKGEAFVYISREYVNIDEIFGEDSQSYFKNGWMFAAYIVNYESFEGAGSFFSKFGYESDDEIELEFNPSLFAHQVNGLQPRAGDLVYAPKINCLFEITYVQPVNPYGQLGSTQALRKISCTKFTPSHEEMDVSIDGLGESLADPINIPEFDIFSDIENPINNLNGKASSRTDGNDYADSVQAEKDLEGILDPYHVPEGLGKPMPNEEDQDPFRFFDK